MGRIDSFQKKNTDNQQVHEKVLNIINPTGKSKSKPPWDQLTLVTIVIIKKTNKRWREAVEKKPFVHS